MALPPGDEGTAPEPASPRAELRLVEASEARERKCAECGRSTTSWKPVRRKGASILVCPECAAKPPSEDDVSVCPQCRAPLAAQDGFCGKCGAKIEYACPQCGTSLAPEDTFCGKCGTRLA